MKVLPKAIKINKFVEEDDNDRKDPTFDFRDILLNGNYFIPYFYSYKNVFYLTNFIFFVLAIVL